MPEHDMGEDRLGSNGDAFYEMLMQAHDGLDEAESHALNMRLVLILANRIADLPSLEAAISAAKKDT